MLVNNSPVFFETGQQLNQHELNEAFATAKAMQQEQASKRYNYFDISTRAITDGNFLASTSGNIIDMPRIDGLSYVIERVTVTGTYTGQPTISINTSSDATPIYSLTLPPDGFDGAEYTAVLLPGLLLNSDGGSGTTNTNNICIRSDVTLPNMRAVVTCRTTHNLFTTSHAVSDLFYFDQDIILASGVNDNLTALSTHKTTWSANNAKPKFLTYLNFLNITQTTDSSISQSLIPMSGPLTISRVVGRIWLYSVGAAGQTATISYGNGSLTNSTVVSVDGLNSVYFDSGAITLTDSSRSITSSSDDIKVGVTTNGATTLGRVDIFFLCQ